MDTNKKTLIFDFDGTIADTMHTILGIYNDIIAPIYNCLPIELRDIEKVRSLHSRDAMRQYNVNVFKLPFMILRARKELSRKIKEVKAAGGVIEALKEIRQYNCTMGILTQNSKKNVKVFLKSHCLENDFDFVYTSLFAFNKHSILKKILHKRSIDSERCIYIGDETRDIDAAKKAGIKCAAVSWGYSARKALACRKPDRILYSPDELLQLV